MDLTEEELELQREALIRIEQERKDAEIARRLEEREAAERADRTLTPEEIARILDERLDDPVQMMREIRVGNRRNRPNNLDGQAVRVQNAPRDRRRRLNDDDDEGLAHGEPIPNRRRLILQLEGEREQLRITFGGNRVNNINVDVDNGSSSDSEVDEEEEDENGDNEMGEMSGEEEEIEMDEEVEDEASDGETSSSEDDDDSDIIVENIVPPQRFHDQNRDIDHIAFNARPIFEEEAEFQAAYRGELEILEVPDLIDMAPLQRAGVRTLQVPVTPPRNNRRDAQYGDCTLCFEIPVDPTGCNQCKQLLGCRSCINTWYVSSFNSHRVPTCPLCRCRWSNRPDVRQMRYIEAEKRRAHLRRSVTAPSATRNRRH